MKRLYIWQNPKWPDLTWDADRLIEPIARARFRQGALIAKILDLGMQEGRQAEADVLSEEAVKTAAIEGERLSPESVRSSVARHLGLPTAGLPPSNRSQSVDGLVEVLLDATRHYARPLTVKRIKGWQAGLFPTGFSGLRKIRVGKWRGSQPMQVVSGPFGRERVHFEAPPFQRIEAEVKGFLSWWKSSFGKVEGFLRAGVAHFRFVTIHPFEDGNGRLARALTDMALAQDEKQVRRYYSLSSQIMKEREDYYSALEAAQKGGLNITEWLLWFLSCLERSLDASEDLLAGVLAKVGFWRRHAQTPLTPHQRKVINRLLDSGPAGFQGGLTTRKYVAMTKVSRATAYREIADLVSKKIVLPNPGKGRNVSYGLAW